MKLSGRLKPREWWRGWQKKPELWHLHKTEWEKREGSNGVSMCVVETYWWREQIQLWKHHPGTDIRTELPREIIHPQSSSSCHHQTSLHFNASLPLTDLCFFFPSIVCCESDEFVLSGLVMKFEECGMCVERPRYTRTQHGTWRVQPSRCRIRAMRHTAKLVSTVWLNIILHE